MKLLQIPNYFYPNRGGIEQVARDITKAVSSPNEQKVICFNETAADGAYICKREETVTDTVDGVEVIRCGCVRKVASQSVSFTFGEQLKKVMADFRPDTVIFHYPNPLEAYHLLSVLPPDTRMILYWHLDITKQRILGKLFHGQTERLLKRAETVVATSPVYIDGSPYLSRYRSKCTVIPNCIDADRLKTTPEILLKAEEIRRTNEGKILCFGIGRHIPYKGFRYLIEASQFLDDRFRIMIGGKGELTEELKKQAEGDEKVFFLGRVSDDDLIAYYLAMDIFCFPSITKNEAFGIALAEAMSFGKPAVTFHIPGSGVNYVNLKDVTGLEVENGNSRAYAEAIKQLADDKPLREKLGQAAKKRADTLFSAETFRKNISNLLSGGAG